jgi:hypothetical protein
MDTDTTDTPTDYKKPVPDYFQTRETREILNAANEDPMIALGKAMEEGKQIQAKQKELKKEGYLGQLKKLQEGKDVTNMSKKKEDAYNSYLKRTDAKEKALKTFQEKGITVYGGIRTRRRHKKSRKTMKKSRKHRKKSYRKRR